MVKYISIYMSNFNFAILENYIWLIWFEMNFHIFWPYLWPSIPFQEGKNKVTTSHLGSHCQHFLIGMVSLVTVNLPGRGFSLSWVLSCLMISSNVSNFGLCMIPQSSISGTASTYPIWSATRGLPGIISSTHNLCGEGRDQFMKFSTNEYNTIIVIELNNIGF